MAQTLSSIQVLARYESRDQSLDLTTTEGLAVANMLYRRIVLLVDWTELIRTDTSLSTTAGTSSYTWPSTNVYMDVKAIEIQDSEDENKYKVIAPVRTELDWSIQREKENSFPLVYRRHHNGTNNVVEFAPTPNIGSLTVRIIGKIEPTAFTSASSTTLFLNNSADEALALLIASDVADKRNQTTRSEQLLRRASEILSSLSGKDITPSEIKGGQIG